MEEKNKKQRSIFDYIFRFAGPRKKQYTLSIILAFIGVLFSLIPYVLMGDIIRRLLAGEKDLKIFWTEGAAMAISWIFRQIFHTASTKLSHRTTFGVIANVRIALGGKLSRLPLGTVLGIPSGALKNIIVERTDSMETTLAHVIPEFTANLAAPLLMFVYIIFLDWRMALLSLATLPIGALCMAWMMRDYEGPFLKTQETTKALNDAAVEYINGIEVIKAFGKAQSSYKRFSDRATDNAMSFITWMRANIVPQTIAMAATPSTLLAVLPVGALFVMNGSLTLPDYITVIVLSCGLITPLITVMSYTDDIQKAGSIFGEIQDILDLPELVRPKTSTALPANHGIVLENVRFGYNEKEVLHGINLTMENGSVTAFVGPSGSGKSTVARLIASLWDVKDGSIKIGGADIRELSLEDYNSQVAYVSQDNFLFNTTIRENIRMGRPDAADSEVEQIAKESGCYDFIMGLENGFDTIVGGSGAHLSGGERQRIAIARAMMKNAPILILDEATAYTDPENEAIIQHSVSKLAQGKTLIVIAHRLSTVMDSDKIVVIENGNVAAEGTHKELLNTSSLYGRMWQAHISAKDNDEGGRE